MNALNGSYYPAQNVEQVMPTTVGGVLRAAVADAAELTAMTEVRDGGKIGRSWAYGDLLRDAERLAASLSTRFVPGERIAIWSPNTPEWAILEFAAALAGLTLVTVNPAFQAKELRYVLAQSRSVGLFFVREFRGNQMAALADDVRAQLPLLRHLIEMDDTDALYGAAGAAQPLPDVHPESPAQIQYTSGTTGFPKGAVLSHRSLTNNSRFGLGLMGARKGDNYLNVMPMFHTAGCAFGMLGSIQWRCRVVMAKLFDAANMISVIERERVNLMVAVPTMLISMLEALELQSHDLSSLRVVLSGGATVPPDLVSQMQSKFRCPLTIIYGQTETSPGLTQTRTSDSLADRTDTVGQAYPCTELSVRNLVSNAVVPISAIGEVCARGYCNMVEYNDDVEATAKTIDHEGWLHTGDLGTMDARGYLRITGRVKDMIIRGGENLFPAEIENVLATHADIAEVAVVGVPDAKWGEIAICFVRAKSGAKLVKSDLIGHVRKNLAAPKTPAQWVTIDVFPLTATGKIQKFVLRDRFLTGEYVRQVLEF